ncbi:DNA repair protein RadA [Thermodesulforhabdus norvegica]|uniref:DNA repair protein RadA n=1 Tax=Thermodesulforhabdus norvegica TaxID=39841 RepID=A0A1I4S895_9BACT|nr:DNA repair protein RadA [Thermodesulforhabdus norvegica]SFM60712.1 DNA repair protein RadA/Sms [Thermodesulforhabdus norvegica]
MSTKRDRDRGVFICSECGYESAKWLGKCPECGGWNTFEESEPIGPALKFPGHLLKRPLPEVKSLSEISLEREFRIQTPILEWDRVLGGGLVPSSLVLISGDPGMGKSTLLLQVLAHLARRHTVLYISGEESDRQIRLRAERLGLAESKVLVACETSLERIIELAESYEVDILAIDSIQTIASSFLDATPGTVSQIRYCTDRLLQMAKLRNVTVIIVGHVTKEGIVAGPKALEHLVDVVLYLEGDPTHSFRLLRSVKNRYGSTNEIGVFEMKETGLHELTNPSQLLLAERPVGVPGSVVMPAVEGTRALLVEIQALVTYSSLAMPRRTTLGFDGSRASLLMAVLEKRLGLSFAQEDVFINVAGGLRLREPAADLPVCLALMSSHFDTPVSASLVAWGEVGLTGEVRAVGYGSIRLNEAVRLGFNEFVIPASTAEQMKKEFPSFEARLIGVASLREAVLRVFPDVKGAVK